MAPATKKKFLVYKKDLNRWVLAKTGSLTPADNLDVDNLTESVLEEFLDKFLNGTKSQPSPTPEFLDCDDLTQSVLDKFWTEPSRRFWLV